MKTKSTGWDRLNCSFFESACRRALGRYFELAGFREIGSDVVGGLVFERDGVFLEVSYEPETFPKYSPTVILGLGSSAQDPKWRLTAVPMWFVVPADRPENRYPFWTFDSEENAALVLERIRSAVLEVHAKGLWLDQPKLRETIDLFLKKS